MPAIKETPQVGDVRLVGDAGSDLIDELTEPGDLVGDLRVRPAHGGGRVGAAEQPVEDRVKLGLLGIVVRPDAADQPGVGLADQGHRLG